MPRLWLMALLDRRGNIIRTRIVDELDRMSLPPSWITVSEYTVADQLATMGVF